MGKTGYKKISLGILGSLAVGILGSALWEWMFSPLFSSIFMAINNFLISVSERYSNNLYRLISSGVEYMHVQQNNILIINCTLLLLSVVFLLIDPVSSILKKKPHYAICLMLISPILAISNYSSVSRYSLASDLSISCYSNIEIVAPYISELEYKTLHSRYYQIESKEDYDSLMAYIEEIASSKDIALK